MSRPAPLAYRVRNLPYRVRGLRAEFARLMSLGLTSELRARRLDYARLRELARLHGRWEVLWLYELLLREQKTEELNSLLDAIAGDTELAPAVTDYGVVSRRVVTNAGVAFLTDCFQNLAEAEAINWHDSGTGTAAEAVTDTTITAAGPARVAGTQSEPASNQYRTVGTITYSATAAITEHGLFTASAAGSLWDRSVFAAINVGSGDSIQFTYTLTSNAGG